MRAALKTESGLIVTSVGFVTHMELAELAEREGLRCEQSFELGWVNVSSYRKTPRPSWPGLVAKQDEN